MFLDWAQDMKRALKHCHYEEYEKIEAATLYFEGDAKSWWNRYEHVRENRGWEPVATFDQLIYVMTKKYVPDDFKNDMRMQIAEFQQGKLTPVAYLAKLEDMYMKAGISASPSALRTKFMSGLNPSIRRPLEIAPYRDLGALCHAAMKLHKQQQETPRYSRYNSSQNQYAYSTNTRARDVSSYQESGSTKGAQRMVQST